MPSNYNHVYPSWTSARPGQPIKNNSATVMLGGNTNTTTWPAPNVTNPLPGSYLGIRSGISAGSVVPGPYTPVPGISIRCVGKAISAGTYAVMVPGQYQFVGFSTVIAGLPSTVLRSPAADYGRLPYPARVTNYLRTRRIIMTGGWYYVTGKPVAPADFADSLPALPFETMGVPGRITFSVSGSKITTQNYAAKTE